MRLASVIAAAIVLGNCSVGMVDPVVLAELQGDWVSGDVSATVSDVVVLVSWDYHQELLTIAELSEGWICGRYRNAVTCYEWSWRFYNVIEAEGYGFKKVGEE